MRGGKITGLLVGVALVLAGGGKGAEAYDTQVNWHTLEWESQQSESQIQIISSQFFDLDKHYLFISFRISEKDLPVFRKGRTWTLLSYELDISASRLKPVRGIVIRSGGEAEVRSFWPTVDDLGFFQSLRRNLKKEEEMVMFMLPLDLDLSRLQMYFQLPRTVESFTAKKVVDTGQKVEFVPMEVTATDKPGFFRVTEVARLEKNRNYIFSFYEAEKEEGEKGVQLNRRLLNLTVNFKAQANAEPQVRVMKCRVNKAPYSKVYRPLGWKRTDTMVEFKEEDRKEGVAVYAVPLPTVIRYLKLTVKSKPLAEYQYRNSHYSQTAEK